MANVVYAAAPMIYGGQQLDARQVIEPKGLKLDVLLLRQKRLVPIPKKRKWFECGECGAVFLDETARRIHGNKRHN